MNTQLLGAYVILGLALLALGRRALRALRRPCTGEPGCAKCLTDATRPPR